MAKVSAKKSSTPKAPKHAGYRVYRITDSLRSAVTTKREVTNTTNKAIIEAAVAEKLPIILQTLVGLGLTAKVGQAKRPARWQVSDDTLGALRVASAQCGIPATKLLMASLALLCGDAPKTRKERKAGAK